MASGQTASRAPADPQAETNRQIAAVRARQAAQEKAEAQARAAHDATRDAEREAEREAWPGGRAAGKAAPPKRQTPRPAGPRPGDAAPLSLSESAAKAPSRNTGLAPPDPARAKAAARRPVPEPAPVRLSDAEDAELQRIADAMNKTTDISAFEITAKGALEAEPDRALQELAIIGQRLENPAVRAQLDHMVQRLAAEPAVQAAIGRRLTNAPVPATPVFQGREDDPRGAHGRVVDPVAHAPAQGDDRPALWADASAEVLERRAYLPARGSDDALDWGETRAALDAVRERLDGRSDPSVEELRALDEDVWDSLPGSDAERALMRQMVTPEDWLTAARADPETEAAWRARVEETGRLFDPDSYGMQTLFQGPDGHVYRRDPDTPPRPELLQAFMVSRGLESWAWKLRNRQGLIDMDPEVWRELLAGAMSGAPGWAGSMRVTPRIDSLRERSLDIHIGPPPPEFPEDEPKAP